MDCARIRNFCTSTYTSFSQSMKEGWCGRVVTASAGVATLAGPVYGVMNGLVKKDSEKYGADYMSKVICRAGAKFSPINGVMQTYIKGIGKYILPALPLVTIAGGVLWRAGTPSGDKGYLTRVLDEAKNVPWKRVAYAVTTTAVAVCATVGQSYWTSALNEAYPDAVSADPSGHVLMTLAIGWATLFAQSAASAYDQPFISLGTTVGMVALSIANATFLEHTAWVCHTTREVYEGLAIGIGIPVTLGAMHLIGSLSLWGGGKAIQFGCATCSTITNIFTSCCRRTPAAPIALTVVDEKCKELGLVDRNGQAFVKPSWTFAHGTGGVNSASLLSIGTPVLDHTLDAIMEHIREVLNDNPDAEITADMLRKADLLNSSGSRDLLVEPMIVTKGHLKADGTPVVKPGETHSKQTLNALGVPAGNFIPHPIVARLLELSKKDS